MKNINGIKELEEMTNTFNDLISNVFIASSGCDNTATLVENLMKTYVAVHNLQKAIKEI